MSSIFTRIINGELPGHFVWQDEICVAIMTIQPVNSGHVLVIPRQEIDHWDDLEDEAVAHLMKVGRKIGKAIKAGFSCKRIGVVIAGFEVPHVHVHIIPTNSLDDFSFTGLAMANAEDLAAAAATIKKQLELL